MRKNMLFVLLLTMGAMLANANSAAARQRTTEALATKPEAVPAGLPKTEAAPAPAATAEAVVPKTDGAQAQTEDPKLTSVPGGKALGMSILGNQEAPKALVIVPWKRSELGSALDVSTMLDDSRNPVDKEVFMRMLSYYEIRSETHAVSAPAKTNAAQPANAALRRNQ